MGNMKPIMRIEKCILRKNGECKRPLSGKGLMKSMNQKAGVAGK